MQSGLFITVSIKCHVNTIPKMCRIKTRKQGDFACTPSTLVYVWWVWSIIPRVSPVRWVSTPFVPTSVPKFHALSSFPWFPCLWPCRLCRLFTSHGCVNSPAFWRPACGLKEWSLVGRSAGWSSVSRDAACYSAWWLGTLRPDWSAQPDLHVGNLDSHVPSPKF